MINLLEVYIFEKRSARCLAPVMTFKAQSSCSSFAAVWVSLKYWGQCLDLISDVSTLEIEATAAA